MEYIPGKKLPNSTPDLMEIDGPALVVNSFSLTSNRYDRWFCSCRSPPGNVFLTGRHLCVTRSWNGDPACYFLRDNILRLLLASARGEVKNGGVTIKMASPGLILR